MASVLNGRMVFVFAFVLLIVTTLLVVFFTDIHFDFDEYTTYRNKTVKMKVNEISVGRGWKCFKNYQDCVFCPPINVDIPASLGDSLFKHPNNDTIWIYDKFGQLKTYKQIIKP